MITPQEKIDKVKKFFEYYAITDDEPFNPNQIDLLYEIANGNIADFYDDDIINNTVGLFYRESNEEKSEKYLLQATNSGNYTDAFYNLADLYLEMDKRDLAEKYYLSAIELNDKDAVFDLAELYRHDGKFILAEKYYKMACDNSNSGADAMFSLGLMYEQSNQLDLAEKYYLMAFQSGNKDVIYSLGQLYISQNKIDSAEKYCLLADDISTGMLYLGKLLEKKENPTAEKFYLMAIEKNNKNAPGCLGFLYHQQSKYDLAEKYYLMAIDAGDIGGIISYAYLLYEKGDNDQSEKYFLMAHDKGSTDGTLGLANLYMNIDCQSLAEKYFLIIMEKTNNYSSYKNLESLYENQPVKLYNALLKLSVANLFVQQKLGELLKIYSVKCFDKKRRLLSKRDICPICLEEDKVLIPRECVHYYCLDCYVKIEKCAYCENGTR